VCGFGCTEPGKDIPFAEGSHRRPRAAGGHDCSPEPLKCPHPQANCGRAKNAVWGSFTRGDAKGFSDETPVHRVRPNSFYVKITEVTNDEYVLFLNPGRRGSTLSPWHITASTASMRTAAERGPYIFGERHRGAPNRIPCQFGTFVSESGYGNHPAVKITWHVAVASRNYGSPRPARDSPDESASSTFASLSSILATESTMDSPPE
jgi:hypothetical protein